LINEKNIKLIDLHIQMKQFLINN